MDKVLMKFGYGYIFNWGIFNYTKDTDNIEELIKEYYFPNIIFKDKLKPSIINKMIKTLTKYLQDTLQQFSKEKNDDKLNDYSIMAIRTILHDLLLQEDKLAMAHSVESRVPFVDNHRIVELSMNIEGKLKIKDGREKYILREYGKNLLPDSIIKRKKYAFPEPPDIYDYRLREICNDNWKEISNCKIIKKIIEPKYLKNNKSFTDRELWWLLVYWRFENVFRMEEI